MKSVASHLPLLCVVGLLGIHNPIPSSGEGEEETQDPLHFSQKVLQVYQALIKQAQDIHPDCVLDHPERFQIFNKKIDEHWEKCVSTVPRNNVPILLGCMQVEAYDDMEDLLLNVYELKDCLRDKDEALEDCSHNPSCVDEWTKQVYEVKNNLTAVKKINEFYVAVENAKLANKTKCYDEFYPMVEQFTKSVDTVVENCCKFVPAGHLDEFKQCCEHLCQPIESDVNSKMMYVCSCQA